ncbi:RNA polymerase factor sigma-32 [Magnetospirillum sp. UT-4]|uniref:RNA polymerase factor sigma-32 n=1 Tax=Magnetospirillum sp. UT-4 TaxID=2681467 RepID=UPI00138278B5|nr:RNA polymerase factor sigma-32 [Magnetospirillum sp. UT-4]CAA7616862.1 RNA polymerase sigma factor RpoH [Magnetospirillum sp. UT-4]
MSTPRASSDPATSYFRALREAPLLSGEDEAELIRRWRDNSDEGARTRLIEAHLRLVAKTAAQFKGYGLGTADLIAEGNLGLVRALETFEPERGLRFSTYAQWWVRAAMFEYVLKFSTPVNFGLSAERKRLFFKLRGLKARLTGPSGGSLSAADTATVAAELGVKPERVAEMERLMTQPPRSLDAPVVEGGASFGELLADDTPSVEERLGERQELMYRRELLKHAWSELTERERDIVAERTLRDKPLRLEDLAQRYNISRERVRQIEASALGKLKTLVAGAPARLAAKPAGA